MLLENNTRKGAPKFWKTNITHTDSYTHTNAYKHFILGRWCPQNNISCCFFNSNESFLRRERMIRTKLVFALIIHLLITHLVFSVAINYSKNKFSNEIENIQAGKELLLFPIENFFCSIELCFKSNRVWIKVLVSLTRKCKCGVLQNRPILNQMAGVTCRKQWISD